MITSYKTELEFLKNTIKESLNSISKDYKTKYTLIEQIDNKNDIIFIKLLVEQNTVQEFRYKLNKNSTKTKQYLEAYKDVLKYLLGVSIVTLHQTALMLSNDTELQNKIVN